MARAESDEDFNVFLSNIENIDPPRIIKVLFGKALNSSKRKKLNSPLNIGFTEYRWESIFQEFNKVNYPELKDIILYTIDLVHDAPSTLLYFKHTFLNNLKKENK